MGAKLLKTGHRPQTVAIQVVEYYPAHALQDAAVTHNFDEEKGQL